MFGRTLSSIATHGILLLGLLAVAFPIYVALVASSYTAEELLASVPLTFGDNFLATYHEVVIHGIASTGTAPAGPMLLNSLAMAMGITIGKIAVSIISAFAIVYFRFPGRMLFFWVIFTTLLLPVEVRIVPTFKVVADLGMLNSYAGLTIPLIASATATFLFRQFFLTVPDELIEAARIDGAGPMRFFRDILLPLSRTNMAALFVIMFIYGWNQYLWPLMVTTDEGMYTIVMGIQRVMAAGDDAIGWNYAMAMALLAMLPPVVVVIAMQRLFIKGLVETEK